MKLTKMLFIKEESEDVMIEETFRVKHEDTVVNFFLVEAETKRRWDIFQAEVPLY